VLKIGGSRGTLQRVYGLDGTDRMFASKGSNLIVGSDVNEEEKVMKIWYDETDDKVYMRTKGKAGVTISNPTEIVEFTLSG
jgi:tryptophanyl-tRNA synthetase